MRCLNKPVKFFLTMIAIFLFAGCASKEPQIVTKIEYQDVLVPIRCINKMPNKPKYDYEDIQTARELMEYYKTCEELLKGCASQGNEKSKGASNE
ncbi:hypothetical protein CAMRE0001_2436 [Campylobacter rectus RM3267]|uniref:Lipoprotein n=3 Tax=Campylobacter TaxID=194 RepID=A0A842J5N0_9BACT|nr:MULTISPECIES: hypothetical protein [Campylobacter]EEF14050.1 hypothetical protein CAMRE0001_2436 [Campylobacter rectus RM3267]MBC2883196.1 hypothetical protein [Campylobacter massiliensis]QCD46989.1 hypothetical protein CRECT_1335 [Campylobacter rectus]UEB47690.1 hypothetical protein LK437_11985 [Campylobacter rectus]